jgi:hypothetical protein
MVTPIFLCDICEQGYKLVEDAIACEQKGIEGISIKPGFLFNLPRAHLLSSETLYFAVVVGEPRSTGHIRISRTADVLDSLDSNPLNYHPNDRPTTTIIRCLDLGLFSFAKLEQLTQVQGFLREQRRDYARLAKLFPQIGFRIEDIYIDSPEIRAAIEQQHQQQPVSF